MQRYFVDKINNKIEFLDSDKKHIQKVMRMKNNDVIEVIFDNKAYCAKIKDINNLELELLDEILLPKATYEVTIAQALVREQKWDLILQKMTELGVHEIIPLKLERCNVKLDNKETKKLERWANICKEASEQSFRSYIPKITKIMELKDLIKLEYDLKIFCSTVENTVHLKKILQIHKKYDKILIVIGPEGGLSTIEEQLMVNNGFIRVSLGNLILRTETAPIYVLSAINYEKWS